MAGMPKAAKRLTKKEARDKGERGAFAVHLAKLLDERGLTAAELADKCPPALGVKEHQVRAWLRGDNMPQAHILRPLAKVLKLKDVRHILPE